MTAIHHKKFVWAPLWNPSRAHARFIALVLGALAIPMLGGCGVFGGGSGGSGSIYSEQANTELRLSLPTRAATVRDNNTADVYMTDLSDTTLARLAAGESLPEVSGVMTHVHMFLNPKPGKTPIEPTAASTSIRVIVLARGQVGVYDGAGFMLPGRSIKRGNAAGSISDAPARLTRASAGFNDALGRSRIDLSFSASGDEPGAEQIARVMRMLSAGADPVSE